MILFRQIPQYTLKEALPYHIVRSKGWVEKFVPKEMMSLVVATYCGKEFKIDTKTKGSHKMVDINREERQKYKKDVCKDCIRRAVAKKT